MRENLAERLAGLGGLEGIGQAELIARDPLNLRNFVLAAGPFDPGEECPVRKRADRFSGWQAPASACCARKPRH